MRLCMFKRKHGMQACIITLLTLVLLSATAFGQGTNAALSGTVTDATGGIIVGATIMARNVDTGVETRATTNNAGIYNLVLQPGNNYEVYADSPGFQRTTRTGLRLLAGSQTNLPLPMAVAGQVTEIEVTGTVEGMVLEASASTGTVLQEDIIASIPTLAPNVIEATLSIMGGVTRLTGSSTVWAASTQEIAGVASNMINVSRDGVTVSEVRYPTGIAASGNVNPEVVGEMRVIQSAVDAELGRGAGQVQMTTRSGSNAYHGSAVWNIQNTALDATDFSYKQRNVEPNWRNVNNYTATASGPIIRNKTFFFASWEQQFARDKLLQTPRVMTSCARRGIYRWLTSEDAAIHQNLAGGTASGWLPNITSNTNSYNLTTGNLRSVNDDGTPWRGGTVNDSGRGFAETTISKTTVMFESIFGQLRPDIRRELENESNPKGVYGNGVDGCTLMDDLGYDPMNANFLTTGSGNTNAWTSAYRYAYDPTGFAHRFAVTGADFGASKPVIMPPANYYRGQGDGLNSASHQWTMAMVGSGSSVYGTGGDPDRKAITVKIDHNINNDHRVSGTFNWESFYVWNDYRNWPEDYGSVHGNILRKPIGLVFALNSTLKPTVLNEFRFGLSRAEAWVQNALHNQYKDRTQSILRALAGNDASSQYYAGSWAQDELLIIGLGENDTGLNATSYRPDGGNSHPYGNRGAIAPNAGGNDPRWQFSDSLTWIKGTHSFKAGVEYRHQATIYATSGAQLAFSRGGGYTDTPIIRGGVTSATIDRRRTSLANARAAGLGWQNIYNNSQDTMSTTSGNYAMPYAMMSFFSGSISDTSHGFYMIPDPSAPNGVRWNKYTDGEDEYEYNLRNQEFHWFFKDDWKITSNLTLNLGVRWEYYGVPNVKDGRTLALRDGSQSIWGITDPGSFNNNGKGWVVDRNYLSGFERDADGRAILPDPVLAYTFIGPGSQNSDRMLWNRDMNNFAPHVGFAWQLPWFGVGRTTLRGGYSISYSQIDNFNNYVAQFVNIASAGTTRAHTYTGEGDRFDPASSNYYMDLTDMRNILPLGTPPGRMPLTVAPNDELDANAAIAIDENLTHPYVHSLNVSLTRNIGRMFTLDMRYIGTFRRNPVEGLNVNANNFLDTTLFDWIKELDTVRAGKESMYINSLIPHNEATGQLYYSTARNATGSDQLRTQQSAAIAIGNYSTVVNTLRLANGQLTRDPNRENNGLLMRSGCLPGDRPGYAAAFNASPDGRVNVNDFPCQVGTPLNMLNSAPQYQTANLRYNSKAVNNYNSMQAQFTMRPTNGFNFQATYTWSRNIGDSSWTNYLGERDYALNGQHRTHILRTFGSYELPFGSRGLLLRNASGVAKKAVEGWKLSWVLGLESGAPMDVTANSVLWGRSWPILVRPDLWNDKQGKARTVWKDGEFLTGTYLSRDYIKVLDTNICNPDRMSTALYNANCVSAAGGLMGNAVYALALAQRGAGGELTPVLYDSDTRGDDGVTYKAGTPVIVLRSADQSDGRNATGNYKPGRMTSQGIFQFDMAASKSIEFMEGKRFELRIDAQNILNHATPVGTTAPSMEYGGKYVQISPPAMNVAGSGAIGQILNKAGHRTFQAQLRFSF